MSPIINPANAITASRYLTIPPYLYYVHTDQYQFAALMLTICVFCDVIDGKVAKLLGCTSAFGEVFDAITDAICYGVFFVTLAVYQWVPLIPVSIIIGVGALNVVMRAAYAKRAGRATNYRSWAMERAVGYGCFLIGSGLMQYEVEFYFWAFAAMMVLVLAHDTKRMLLDPIPAYDSDLAHASEDANMPSPATGAVSS